MHLTIRKEKRALRAQIRAELRQMPAGERLALSAQARELLAAQASWLNAGSILFYAPLEQELDVWPLLVAALAEGKTVALPHFVEETKTYAACQVEHLPEDLKGGNFGIREPAARCSKLLLNRLDFVLAPGIAFDLHGRRLGRGKGFYDQMLAGVRGRTCGVAFDNQIVREIPVEPHDICVNCILTPTRWLEV